MKIKAIRAGERGGGETISVKSFLKGGKNSGKGKNIIGRMDR